MSHDTFDSDRTAISPDRPGEQTRPRRNDAEAVLVEHYPRLLRLAHLVLPPGLGRHRRVLAAHALVQKSLSGTRRARPPRVRVPPQRGETDQAIAWLRERVLTSALRAATRRRPFPLRPLLPAVLGLRLFPRAGGDGEFALDRELAEVSAEVRAAFALLVLEEMDARSAARLLTAAGVREPAHALHAAARLREVVGSDAESLLRGAEFDPCTVQTRPTDLLRRRQRTRIAGAAALLLIATAAGGVLDLRADPDAGSPAAAQGPLTLAPATEPGRLVRTPQGLWADTARVDLTAWPARGTRTDDHALLARALDTWADTWARGPLPRAGGERSGTRMAVTPGTATTPPVSPPRLLYAGTVDGTAVVLLHDDRRVVRYAEPLAGRAPAVLELARADDADVTTGAALVVSRAAGQARFLLAPWIDESAVRDLRHPDRPARTLEVSGDGVTAPVPEVAGDCSRVPALELRSSTRIVENHAFLLADLGELAPVHLTWTPAPGAGAPARQPREATSAAGLGAWSRSACTLPALRTSGVRAVNRWEFARQSLPERGGTADWTCLRAENWEGRARVTVAVDVPSGAALPVPGPRPEPADTAACGRFGQHMLAGTYWTAPSGARYYLAAGSRRLTSITVRGALSATARGPALAVRTDGDGDEPIRLTGTPAGDGDELRGWGEEPGQGPDA
ncbi:hypothetical protein ACIPPS_14065 [Streptomyces sp. NPDC090127]|uniref:hypothetical protein n=1 Tax=Streptomyces sp. NPDC090127 TaxID=3365953 RepID=UPI0037FA7380